MFFRAVLRGLLSLALFLLGSKRVTGYEHVPASGPFIVVTNHMSVADAPLLFLVFPHLRLRFFAGEKWERHIIEAKEGAAYLASRAQVPILPMGVVNTDVIWENALHLRRTRLEVHIGKPFTLPVGKRAK